MAGLVNLAERIRRLEAVRVQDLADEKLYLSRIEEKNKLLLEQVEKTIREVQEKWTMQMQALSDSPIARDWLEFISGENDMARERSLVNLRAWLASSHVTLMIRFKKDAEKSLSEWIRKFVSGPQTEERLTAIIYERAATRQRQMIDEFYKKDQEYLTIFGQKRDQISSMLQVFTRIYQRGIS